MIKGKVYKCKYKFTYDILQQPSINFYIGDYNSNIIQVIIQDADISNINKVEGVIKNINNKAKNTQTENISIYDNIIEIKLKDKYINEVAQYELQLALSRIDNDIVLERVIIHPISFNMNYSEIKDPSNI